MRAPVRIAVTGDPGSGKTTLIRRAVDALRNDLRIGGIYTSELREGRERAGFTVVDIATGRSGVMARVNAPSDVQVGRYGVDVASFESVAVPALREARASSDLVVVDEVAPMELACPAFVKEFLLLLRGTKPLLVTFQRHGRHPLCKDLWNEFRVEIVAPGRADRPATVAYGEHAATCRICRPPPGTRRQRAKSTDLRGFFAKLPRQGRVSRGRVPAVAGPVPPPHR